MKLLLQEIRRNPLLWLLVFVPVALAAEKLNHEAHTLHFILSVLAILPLAILLSHATESVAVKTVTRWAVCLTQPSEISPSLSSPSPLCRPDNTHWLRHPSPARS